MEDIRFLDKKIRHLYDVADVIEGFDYWFWKITNLLLQMFDYTGLPEELPQREIELNLLITGHCIILRDENGELFAPISSIYGQDKYYQPTHAIFANPVVDSEKEYTINEDCSIIYNSSLKDSMWYIRTDNGMLTFIKRYARKLADVESTINIYTVNQRLTAVPVTEDQNVAQSIKAFFKKLIQGKREIITDNNLIESFRNVDIISKTTLKDGINDWLIARDKILEQMYRELGVRMYQPKKAQVTESELESNDQMLLIALDDMLKSRKEGLEKVNQMFNTNINISINKNFDIIEVQSNTQNQGGITNEDNNGRIIRGTEQG
jgi:hypothetical protein